MPNLQHKHGGIVLAAGASSRMGSPKALLPMPSGRPLAAEHAHNMKLAGVADVIVVLGHEAESLAEQLEVHRVRCAFNAGWKNGRLSSLQVGISALPSDFSGALIVPVDAVHIRPGTFAAVLNLADQGEHAAVRACYQGKVGHVLWISRGLFATLLALKPDPSFRVDRWIAPRETRMEVDDPAILNNINTPQDWGGRSD